MKIISSGPDLDQFSVSGRRKSMRCQFYGSGSIYTGPWIEIEFFKKATKTLKVIFSSTPGKRFDMHDHKKILFWQAMFNSCIITFQKYK